ncbi:MAG: divergent polysaccharide deacetylase family protein [Candidatus Omnitrophica bacterium]|nr:divergent polysaccharide deacetylase family protein [Candidatus Omnitrophota bacterium]MDD5672310.1 divergent polysaccharide deacetylase family protein [Candidatus Omnitrophota bacterium]
MARRKDKNPLKFLHYRHTKTSIRLKPKIKKRIMQAGFWIKIGLALLFLYFVIQFAAPHFKIKLPAIFPGKTAQIRETKPAVTHPERKQVQLAPPFAGAPARPARATKKPRVLTPGMPKIAIVIDDIGYTSRYQDLLENLGDQVTYAILPHLEFSQYFDDLSQRTGADVILHMPLEPLGNIIPGPGLITASMDKDQIRETLELDLQSVPSHVGVNNHMGSRGTQDPKLMKVILSALNKKKLFFLDSVTSSQTVGPEVAEDVGIPVLRRDVFLDNIDSSDQIRRRLEELVLLAKQNGYAVGIGHYHFKTLDILNKEIPNIKNQGIEIVSLSDMIRWKYRR